MLAYIINKKPYIIHTQIHDLPVFQNLLKNEKCYFLINHTWFIDNNFFDNFKFDPNPEHKLISLSNTQFEDNIFKDNNQKGIESVWINHNSFLDPNVFFPINVTKKYNAVYNARFATWKRHQLALKVKDVACICWGFFKEEEKENFEKLKNNENFKFLNNIKNEQIIKKNDKELNDIYNESYVGLCLSEIEGAMYSSTEYLLSGLPVFSTKSLGGRDVFFDDYNSIIVEDSQEAVADAINYLIKNYEKIDKNKIRNDIIKRQQEHIKRFKILLKNIFNENNIYVNIDDFWGKIYTNKMFKWYKNYDDFLKNLA
jgi:glycosyltransferase involved in cell wall biosynthesis